MNNEGIGAAVKAVLPAFLVLFILLFAATTAHADWFDDLWRFMFGPCGWTGCDPIFGFLDWGSSGPE